MENFKKSTLFGKEIFLSPNGTGGIDEYNIIETVFNAIQKVKGDKKKITYFDIGANQGNFSLLPLFDPSIICYGFEPNPPMFEILTENIKLNSLEKNVKAFNIGVSNTIEKLKLKVPLDDNDHGLSTFADDPKDRFSYDNKPGDYKIVEVDCLTLDNIVTQLEIESLDVIKIDTEGSELNILLGGEQSLRKFKPVIVMEYQDINSTMFGYNREVCVELLKTYGYNSFQFAAGTDSNLLASEFELGIQ
jgi:FkbM family methyltransferase